MSFWEKMRYDAAQNPLRAYMQSNRGLGRSISWYGNRSYDEVQADVAYSNQYMSELGDIYFRGVGGTLLGTTAAPMAIQTVASMAPSMASLATLGADINYATTAGYIYTNGELAKVTDALSIGLATQGQRVLNSPLARYLSIHHKWLRGPLQSARQSVQNINLNGLGRGGEPTIPLDVRSPWSGLWNAWKSLSE